MQAIRTRLCPPTNTKGMRIQAKCEAGAIYVHYDHALNLEENHREACRSMLLKMKWVGPGYETGMVGGYFAGDWYWVFMDGVFMDDLRTQDNVRVSTVAVQS